MNQEYQEETLYQKDKWQIQQTEIYSISQETKNKSLRKIQQKLRSEKTRPDSLVKFQDLDQKMGDQKEKERNLRRQNFSLFQKKMNSIQERLNKRIKKEKVYEPHYLKTFRFYVDEVVSQVEKIETIDINQFSQQFK